MADLDALLDALDTIYAHRGTSAVVVSVDGRDGLYAEVWADRGSEGLTADIVGNEDLPPEAQLSPEQEEALRARGWDDATTMWRREWPSTPTRADRQRVAYETLRVIGEVYGASGAVRVEEVILPEDAPAGPKASIVVAIAAALLALAGALAALMSGG